MTAADCLVGQTDHSWQLPCSVTNAGAPAAPRGGRPLSPDCRQSRRGSSELASKAAGTCGRSGGAKAWRWEAALAGPGTGWSACKEPGRAACGTDPRRALAVETSLPRSLDFHLGSRENELHRGRSTQADCGVRTGARRLQGARSGLTVQPHSRLAQSKTHSLARALGPWPWGTTAHGHRNTLNFWKRPGFRVAHYKA